MALRVFDKTINIFGKFKVTCMPVWFYYRFNCIRIRRDCLIKSRHSRTRLHDSKIFLMAKSHLQNGYRAAAAAAVCCCLSAVVSSNLVTKIWHTLRSDKNELTIFFFFYLSGFYLSGFSPSLSCASLGRG